MVIICHAVSYNQAFGLIQVQRQIDMCVSALKKLVVLMAYISSGAEDQPGAVSTGGFPAALIWIALRPFQMSRAKTVWFWFYYIYTIVSCPFYKPHETR